MEIRAEQEVREKYSTGGTKAFMDAADFLWDKDQIHVRRGQIWWQLAGAVTIHCNNAKRTSMRRNTELKLS